MQVLPGCGHAVHEDAPDKVRDRFAACIHVVHNHQQSGLLLNTEYYTDSLLLCMVNSGVNVWYSTM